MAYPVDIPPTLSGYSLGTNGSRGRYLFEYSGAIYAFLSRNSTGTTAGDFKIHALYSTDQGQTWSELDSSNAPPSNGAYTAGLVSGVGDCYTVFRDGSTAWVLTADVNASQVIQGISATAFDLAAGTWGASTAYTGLAFDYMANNAGGGFQLAISAAVCGAANYQVLMSGTSETISGHRYTRSWFASFDGSSWGTAVEIPNQSGNTQNYAPVSAIGDGTGRACFFYKSDESNPGVWTGGPLYCIVLDADGVTLGTAQQITTSLYWRVNNVIGSCSEAILAAGQLVIAAELNDDLSSTTQSTHVFYASPALNPTFSDELVAGSTGVDGFDATIPEPDFAFWVPAALTMEYANGFLALAWCVAQGPSKQAYWSVQSSFPTFAWTTPAQLFVPSLSANRAVQIISCSCAAGVGIAGLGYDPGSFADFLAQFYLITFGVIINCCITIGGVANRVYVPGLIGGPV